MTTYHHLYDLCNSISLIDYYSNSLMDHIAFLDEFIQSHTNKRSCLYQFLIVIEVII